MKDYRIHCKSYSVEVVGSIPNEALCTICKLILNDPVLGCCTCSYCMDCIKNWVSKGNVYCPGKGKLCKTAMISVGENVQKDFRAQRQIERLRVRCPFRECKFECHFNEMSNHIESCLKKSHSCPYEEIGCLERNGGPDHLQLGCISHAQLVTIAIKNNRRQIDGLQKDVTSLRKKLDDANRTIVSLQRFVENNNRVLQELAAMRNVVSTLTFEIERIKATVISSNQETGQIQKKLNSSCALLMDIKQETVVNVSELHSMEQKLTAAFDSIDKLQKTGDNLGDRPLPTEKCINSSINSDKIVRELESDDSDAVILVDVKAEPTANKQSTPSQQKHQDKLDVPPEPKKQKMNNRFPISVGYTNPFVWHVRNISGKRREAKRNRLKPLYSHCFLTHPNGYRIQLRLFLDGVTAQNYLCPAFVIMKSQHDETLPWPMRIAIRLVIVNQLNGSEFASMSFRYDECLRQDIFGRPINTHNTECYHPYFVAWEHVDAAIGVIKDDSIVIRSSF